MASQPANDPNDMIGTIKRLVRTSRQMFQETGRQPAPEELAATSGLRPERVRGLLEIAQRPIRLKPAG